MGVPFRCSRVVSATQPHRRPCFPRELTRCSVTCFDGVRASPSADCQRQRTPFVEYETFQCHRGLRAAE
eukprot:2887389-Amphidinium_carterae.1